MSASASAADSLGPGPVAGALYIVAAPSGAGKSSLVNALLAREPGMRLSISHTTRPPRPGESEGAHYHFVDRPEFERLVGADAFLEHARVHGNHYGTSRGSVEPLLAAGHDVVLEIDYQGARQVRARRPDCIGIFILPPSRAELERRLRTRAQDSASVIAQRLANSREEIAHAGEFDYVLVNEDFEAAVAGLQAIVHSRRLRRDLQLARHQDLIRELLAG
ncbi:MAG TPA: guanylate kinase [Xanthomonadaceae bacterium]|nr:guanylate kinase [Xanthomonadaceae bacterium]